MRFEFVELPGAVSTLGRRVVPVQVEDLEDAPQLCLVDTGSTTNRRRIPAVLPVTLCAAESWLEIEWEKAAA